MAQFHALALHLRPLEVLERLFGEPPLTHPRHIFHAVFPGEPHDVRVPHQDFFAVRGTTDTWIAWLPLGDGGPAVIPAARIRGRPGTDRPGTERCQKTQMVG